MKPTHWMGSSLSDVRDFPDDVRSEVGYAIHLAQLGDKSVNAVPMVGFGGAKVLEVVIDEAGDTYRAVYTVRFPKAVYVLHAFQKKSVRGAATPRPDMNVIRIRLRYAEAHYRERYEQIRERERQNDHRAS